LVQDRGGLVQDRGGAELQTGGILLYVEDLKRGTNKDIGPKDIFEIGSIVKLRALGSVQFCPSSRKAKILTGGILEVCRGLTRLWRVKI
jgi:hypothetical protein